MTDTRSILDSPKTIRLAGGTALLIALIALAFVFELALDAPENDAMLLRLGALPDSGGLHGQYWRLLTFGLLHRNVAHIVENTACLFLLGLIVERRVGCCGIGTIREVRSEGVLSRFAALSFSARANLAFCSFAVTG